MVISGWVGSLIMLPGATASAVTLPPTGAVTVSRRRLTRVLGRHAEHFQARLRAGVFGRGLGVVASRLIQVPVRGGADLVLRLWRSRFFSVSLKVSAALSLSS